MLYNLMIVHRKKLSNQEKPSDYDKNIYIYFFKLSDQGQKLSDYGQKISDYGQTLSDWCQKLSDQYKKLSGQEKTF